MSLEVTAASLEEVLLDELQFSLKKGANYVTRRESVQMYPSGSGGYSYNAIKVIRIPLMASAGQWLDPASLSFFVCLLLLKGVVEVVANLVVEGFLYWTA